MSSSNSKVIIYTDGGCSGNPGPGGWGAVLLWGTHRKEFSGGFRKTTNNRMEIFAIISALRALNRPCAVAIYTDSQYVVNSINQGWARRWQANGWKRNKKERAENPDLWGELLELLDKHSVEFHWVKGHAGTPENERADRLAVAASQVAVLPADAYYEEQLQTESITEDSSFF